MRGVGPTTSAAVAAYRAGKTVPRPSATNGAVMRSLPIGWATPILDRGKRRSWTEQLTRATHDSDAAVACATIVAEMTSWATEGVAVPQIVDAGIKETHYFRSLDTGLKVRLQHIVDASLSVAVFQSARIDTLLRIKAVSIPNASASPARSQLLGVLPCP